MAAITVNYGRGGAGLTPGRGSGSPSLATVLRDIATDLAGLRAAHVALTAKLDTDATAQNAAVTNSQLDTDYASATDPAALLTTAP